MDHHLEAAATVMGSQQALITLAQFQKLGGDRQRASRYVGRGIWERIDTGLYGPAGVPLTWRRQVMAAQLVAPSGSLISHRCGAALLAVGGLVEPQPEISIPAGTRLRRSGVVVHESSDLHLADTRVVDGITVTGPMRLAVDLGSVVSEARYRHSMREIRFALGVSSDSLLRTYLRHKRQGRNGCGALRDWLDRYYGVVGTPESAAELLVLDAILDAGITAPRLQHWVAVGGRRYRLDMAYPEWMIAIEVDGAQHAEDPDVVRSDSTRMAALRRAGWTVIVIRTSHLATDLHAALQRLRRSLAGSPGDLSAEV